MPDNTARLHVYVGGIVQGVGFRFFVLQYGETLNLHGWVRNRFNGQVEVLAEGPKAQLEALLEKLRVGPYSARVDQVDVEWLDIRGDLPPFTVLNNA